MALELSEHQHGRDGRAAIVGSTQSQLAATQKQISTGYRVANSTDDGAAYAIAQGIRSTVGALTSANQQLGNVQGLLRHHPVGLNGISNTMAQHARRAGQAVVQPAFRAATARTISANTSRC